MRILALRQEKVNRVTAVHRLHHRLQGLKQALIEAVKGSV